MTPPLVHRSIMRFRPICGANIENQSTSQEWSSVNCDACLSVLAGTVATVIESGAIIIPPGVDFVNAIERLVQRYTLDERDRKLVRDVSNAIAKQHRNVSGVRHGFCRRCVMPCFVFAGRCGGCDFEAQPNPDARRPLQAADCPFDLALVAGGTVEVAGGNDPAAVGWWQKHGEWMVPIAAPLRSCGCIPGPEHCADHRRRTGASVVPGSRPGRVGSGGPVFTCGCPCHPR